VTEKPPRPAIRPWVLLALTIPCLLVAAGALAAYVLLPPYIEERIIAEARKQGFELKLGGVSLWFGSVSLEDVGVSLDKVPELRARIARVDLSLDGFTPMRAAADAVTVDIRGTVPDVLLSLEGWTRRHRKEAGTSIPVSMSNVELRWSAQDREAPWLEIQGGQVTHASTTSVLTASSAQIAGVRAENVGARLSATDASFSVSIGDPAPGQAKFTVDVDRRASPPRAVVQLAPTPVDVLERSLGIPLPSGDIKATARAELALPERGPAPIEGHLVATLEGYTPPHPVELNGFDFGRRTTLTTDFSMSPDATRIDLQKTEVRAGEFVLRGDGVIVRDGVHALTSMALRGALPCKTIARSVARARAGSVLGKFAGDTAHKMVDGTVAIQLDVHVDTRSPDAPKITPTIGIGCGLRPLTLSELKELGVQGAEELDKGVTRAGERAGELVDSALSRVPPLPSALPPLPKLPPLPFERRREKPEAEDPPARSPGDPPMAN
jgi:hypothetical protein